MAVVLKSRVGEMKAKDVDKKFDEGEDLTQYLDYENATRPLQKQSG